MYASCTIFLVVPIADHMASFGNPRAKVYMISAGLESDIYHVFKMIRYICLFPLLGFFFFCGSSDNLITCRDFEHLLLAGMLRVVAVLLLLLLFSVCDVLNHLWKYFVCDNF